MTEGRVRPARCRTSSGARSSTGSPPRSPDTLLLAEAFWLLEGYFVRTLGMHRVYNSAFMHMLRDEDDAGYRQVIKETLEFDPEILKRYVNFMSNPDEKTAVEQFGKGDKYFGVATLLATLPGLPMLGHGQVEGFGEKYGMEFRRATLDEQPGPVAGRAPRARDLPAAPSAGVVRRGARLPAVRPRDRRRDRRRARLRLLERRRAGSARWSSTTTGSRRRSGRIRDSAPLRASRRPTGRKRQVRRSLAEGLGLPNDPGAFVIFRDARTGLEFIRSCREIWEHGLRRLARRLRRRTSSGSSARSATASPASGRAWPARLGGSGRRRRSRTRCASCQLEPVHVPLRAIFADGLTVAVIDGVATRRAARELERRFVAFLRAVAEATGVDGDPVADRGRIPRPCRAGVRRDGRVGGGCRLRRRRRRAGRRASRLDPRRHRAGAGGRHGLDRRDRATLLAWLALSHTGALGARRRRRAATSLAWYDELRLPSALVGGLHDTGFDEGEAWAVTDQVRVLLALPRPSTMRGSASVATARLLEAWLGLETVRVAIGVNTWEGVEYLDRDRFRELLAWAVRLDTIDGVATRRRASSARDRRHGWPTAAEVAGYRIDRLRAALVAPRRVPSRSARAPKARRATGRATDDPTTRAGSAGGVRSAACRGRAPTRGAAGS